MAGKTSVNDDQEVELTLIKQKLFVDEFFDPTLGNGEVIKKDWKHYDVRDNMANEAFLGQTFRQPPSALPIQNLGEMLFVVKKDKEAFCMLDMALKLYK